MSIAFGGVSPGRIPGAFLDVAWSAIHARGALVTATGGYAARFGGVAGNATGATLTLQPSGAGTSAAAFAVVDDTLCGALDMKGEALRSHRVYSGMRMMPILDERFAPTIPQHDRGAFRWLTTIAFSAPSASINYHRAVCCVSINGATGGNWLDSGGRGFGFVQVENNLRFIARHLNNEIPRIVSPLLLGAPIVPRRWYALEIQVESARRNVPARLTALIDGVPVFRGDWSTHNRAVGEQERLPLPMNALSDYNFDLTIAAVRDDDATPRSYYFLGYRYIVGPTLQDIL